MKLTEVKLGQEITSQSRGLGKVIKKTPKTITVKFEFSTVKQSYKDKESEVIL